MTKKELMVKAHKMAKEIKNEYPEVDYKFQLGLCLAYLHEEGEKEMVELKGSEKQIKWAEEIREDLLVRVEQMRNRPATQGKYISDYLGEDFPIIIRKDKENRALRSNIGNAYLDKFVSIVEKEEKASKFIEVRGYSNMITVIGETLQKGRL